MPADGAQSRSQPARPELLGPGQIAELRTTLPAWDRHDDVIRREFSAPSFLEGVEFVRRVARAAEDRDHHPDIDIRWRTVTLSLTTHSAGGLTGLDVESAVDFDSIAASLGF